MDILPELIAKVRENPDLKDGWAVLEDAILAAGGPHSRLMRLEEGRSSVPLETFAAEQLGRPGKASQGVLTFRENPDEPWSPGVVLTFHRGFVQKVEVDTSWDGVRDGWCQEWIHPLLTRVFAEPVGQLVTDIEVRCTPYEEFRYEGLIESITQGAPLAVRKMYCGDGDQISWTMVPNITGLWAAAPHLETLVLEGAQIELGAVDHPRLRRLELVTGGLPVAPIESLVRARVPALEALEIWFGDSEYGAECDAEVVAPLLARPFERLKRMALINCEFSNALIPAVMDAVWLPQLEILELGQSILTDDGGQALIDHADRLRHLKRLDVSECFLSPSMVTALQKTFGTVVEASGQEQPDEYDGELHYFVSVGE